MLGPQSAVPDANGTQMPVWHDSRLHKVLAIRQRQCLGLLLHAVQLIKVLACVLVEGFTACVS